MAILPKTPFQSHRLRGKRNIAIVFYRTPNIYRCRHHYHHHRRHLFPENEANFLFGKFTPRAHHLNSCKLILFDFLNKVFQLDANSSFFFVFASDFSLFFLFSGKNRTQICMSASSLLYLPTRWKRNLYFGNMHGHTVHTFTHMPRYTLHYTSRAINYFRVRFKRLFRVSLCTMYIHSRK